MQIQPVHCPACQAVVEVPPGAEQVTCEYCGTTSIIEHSAGHVSLKLSQEIAGLKQSLEESSLNTVRSIQAGEENTLRELQHTRLSHELMAVETRLGNIKTEINALNRNTDKKIKWTVKTQLVDLRSESLELTARRAQIQKAIDDLYPREVAAAQPVVAVKQAKKKRWWKGAVPWVSLFFLVATITANAGGDPIIVPLIVIGLVYLFVRLRRRSANKKALPNSIPSPSESEQDS